MSSGLGHAEKMIQVHVLALNHSLKVNSTVANYILLFLMVLDATTSQHQRAISNQREILSNLEYILRLVCLQCKHNKCHTEIKVGSIT